MHHNKLSFLFLGLGFILLVTVGMIFLLPPSAASAQCGSQASSCKSCHETQAQDPVNNDGTAWHTQHAFGDFCYLCHAGNNQATDKTAAHTGMVAPLSDIGANCSSCHPNDTLAKAQVYATTLGQQVSTGGTPATPAANLPAATTVAPAGLTPAPAATQGAVVLSADMVDYSQRYDAVALGIKPVNIGNIILMVLLGVLVLGGGFFVLRREGWISVSFDDPKRVSVQKKYPTDVVDMLPEITRLKPSSRQALQHILAKPKVAAGLFTSIEQLSQDESLDKGSTEQEPESLDAGSSDQEE